MEQTLSKLKNQKLDDAGKLTNFSVPIVTDYDISKLPGYKVETDRSHFHSRFEMHESDQPHPVIVQAVEKNDLKTLQKMIYHADKLLEFDEKLMISSSKGTDRKTNKVDHKEFVFKEEALNASRIRTEVVEKYGYDKSWEWYDDTALHRAIRKGNDKAVKLLLHAGADPTLETGHEDDVYPTALVLVQKPAYSMFQSLSKKKLKNIEMMITTCLSFWNSADYKGSRAGGRKNFDNKCIDMEKMREALELTVAICDWGTDKTKENKNKENKKPVISQNKSQSKSTVVKSKAPVLGKNSTKRPNPGQVNCTRCDKLGAPKCSTQSCSRCCEDNNCPHIKHKSQ